MKRFISGAMAVVLLSLPLMLSACGGNGGGGASSASESVGSTTQAGESKVQETQSTSASAAGAGTSQDSADTWDGDAHGTWDGEVTKLTVMIQRNRPMNEVTDLIRQYIRDTAGVDIELMQVPDNYSQQLALYAADGSIPDAVLCQPFTLWNEYAKEGAWADLTPYLGDVYSDLMDYVGDDWSVTTVDGAIYGVPSKLGTPTGRATFIRQDWLEKLGLEFPKTLDEFTEVMRKFTFNDPDGNGQNDTYGLGGNGGTPSFLMGAFGSSNARAYFLNDDGKTVTDNAISDGYRAALTYLRDIYAEGLMEPEILTCNYEDSQKKWGLGLFGICDGWFSFANNAYLRFDFEALQPDAVVRAILPPEGENGQIGNRYEPDVSEVFAFNRDCTDEQIKAGLRYLELLCDPYGRRMIRNGPEEGEFFEWDPDTNQTTWIWSMDGTGTTKSGKYTGLTDTATYVMLYDEEQDSQTHAYSPNPYLDDGRNGGFNVIKEGSDLRFTTPVREDLFSNIITEEFDEYHTELDNCFSQNQLAFVTGERNIDTEWDAYVEEYKSLGAEIERQSRLDQYNKQYGTDYTFAN